MTDTTTKHTGRCHCGAVCFELEGAPADLALCHCEDCRRCAGAPVMAWAGFAEAQLTMTQGTPKVRNSSGAAMRSFCGDCGTGLFYRNADMLPGVVEVQLATLDDADSFTPAAQFQTAERLGWMLNAHALPAFERFPEPS